MNLIESNQLTMSSREIAELTDKRHDHVMRTIEKLNMKGLLESPQFVEAQNEQNKQFYTVANLQKTDCLVLIARLSPEFMKAIIDRWQELENQQPTLPNFNDPVEAARAWADAKEGEQKALEVIEQQKPAVSFVADYVEASTGSKTFREVAKLLKENERELRAFLVDKKIMYKQAGTWYAYAQHQDAGRFEVKTGVKNGYSFNTTLFTAKGFTWLAGELGRRKALALV